MLVRTLLFSLALSLLLVSSGESARILVLFPLPGKSHFISFSNLLEQLAKRGHELTVVSAYPRADPLKNYKDITIDDYLRQSGSINMFQRNEANVFGMMFFLTMFTTENCERFLSYPQIQELIHSNEEYDLILIELFFSECAYGFIHKFKSPFIQLSANTLSVVLGGGVGNPTFFSYVPEMLTSYSHEMTFTQRLYNTLTGTFLILFRNWYSLPKMEAIMRKHFTDPTLPSIREIETNASFLFLNSHLVFNYPRPFTPNTAVVGGMHITEPKALPKDLQKYMDDAPDGVIYLSFGSHIRSTQMPESMRNAFLEAFSQVKQKVLWKWETDEMPGQPKNVRIEKWLPQNDILAHPNLKLFITHGGIHSIQEATYHATPLIVVPVMGDQIANGHKVQYLGYGIVQEIKDITTSSLKSAIDEIISKPSYAENAKKVSAVFRDQPQKAIDKAVFSVEYVLRHKGAPHMRSAALSLNWFQYHLLDVIAVLVVGASAVVFVSVLSCRALCRRVCSRSYNAKHVSKAKKMK